MSCVCVHLTCYQIRCMSALSYDAVISLYKVYCCFRSRMDSGCFLQRSTVFRPLLCVHN